MTYSKKQVLKIIQSNHEQIKTYGIKKLGIFGSVAKESHHAKSDVDILVEFHKGNKTFDNYMELKFFLENLFGRKVDLVIKEALKERIKSRVLSEVNYARL